MNIQPLSQRDTRWKDRLLGNSQTSTIGGYGCTISCVAMLAGLTPDEVNEKLKKVSGFKDDLIIWAKIKEAIPWLEFEWRGYEYDNDRVLKAIEANGACLVEVDFDGKIATPKDSHWVLYTGNKQMADPWTGILKSTGYYPLTKGFAVIKVLPKLTTEPANVITDQTKIDLGPGLGVMEVQAIRSTLNDLWSNKEILSKQLIEVSTSLKTERESRQGYEQFVDKLWVELNPVGKNKSTENILAEVKSLVLSEDTVQVIKTPEWALGIIKIIEAIFKRGGEK